jgi:acetoin utilization deacetylase AcuC-like enzyme
MAAILHDAAHTYASGRWTATGGGGYQFDVIVPRIWTIHFAEMCGCPEAIPSDWLKDRASQDVSTSSRERVEESVNSVMETCLPLLREATH